MDKEYAWELCKAVCAVVVLFAAWSVDAQLPLR